MPTAWASGRRFQHGRVAERLRPGWACVERSGRALGASGRPVRAAPAWAALAWCHPPAARTRPSTSRASGGWAGPSPSAPTPRPRRRERPSLCGTLSTGWRSGPAGASPVPSSGGTAAGRRPQPCWVGSRKLSRPWRSSRAGASPSSPAAATAQTEGDGRPGPWAPWRNPQGARVWTLAAGPEERLELGGRRAHPRRGKAVAPLSQGPLEVVRPPSCCRRRAPLTPLWTLSPNPSAPLNMRLTRTPRVSQAMVYLLHPHLLLHPPCPPPQPHPSPGDPRRTHEVTASPRTGNECPSSDAELGAAALFSVEDAGADCGCGSQLVVLGKFWSSKWC